MTIPPNPFLNYRHTIIGTLLGLIYGLGSLSWLEPVYAPFAIIPPFFGYYLGRYCDYRTTY